LDDAKEIDYASKTIRVNFKKLELFDKGFSVLISNTYLRFEPYLRKAVFDTLMKNESSKDGSTKQPEAGEYWIRFYHLPEIVK
jgi:hypothetical protein